MKYSYLLFFSIVLFFSNCDKPFATTPGTQGKNKVTGIYITSESLEIIGVWGNPSSDKNGIRKKKEVELSDEELPYAPNSFELNIPYPNPFAGSATVQFQLPVATSINLWYETAYLDQSDVPLPNQSKIERKFRKVYMIKDQNKPAGIHSVQLATLLNNNDEFDENGERIAPGFYRVFLQAGSFIAYHDIYIGGEGSNPPPGLKNYLYFR